MDNKLNKKHTWALSAEGHKLYLHFISLDIDSDLAFELVEMELGEEKAYDLWTKGSEE